MKRSKVPDKIVQLAAEKNAAYTLEHALKLNPSHDAPVSCIKTKRQPPNMTDRAIEHVIRVCHSNAEATNFFTGQTTTKKETKK